MDNSACMGMAKVAQWLVYNNEKPLDNSDKHYCARYSANMAYAFVNGKYGGVSYGDMGQQTYYSGIENLGYTMTEYDPYISKENLAKKLASHTNWYAGSVACYKALDGSGNQRTYGHAQFYLGDGAWTCDRTDNYGTSFVYNNKNSNNYEFRLFTPNKEPSICVEGNYPTPLPPLPSGFEGKVEQYIRDNIKLMGHNRNESEVTAHAFVAASQQYGLDIYLMMAAAQKESHFGVCGKRPKETKSIFSVGLRDDGSNTRHYNHMDESVYDYAKIITTKYLVNGKTVDDLLKYDGFRNYEGLRYATDKNYEHDLSLIRNSIINELK